MKELVKNLSASIRRIPDFPKKGIIFWDMTTLFLDAKVLKKVSEKFYKRYKLKQFDKIAAVESRGFVLGAILAYKLKKPLVLIRKKRKTSIFNN